VLDHGWLSPYLLGRQSRKRQRSAAQNASEEPRGH